MSKYNKLSENDELIKSLSEKKTDNPELNKSIKEKLKTLKDDKTVTK